MTGSCRFNCFSFLFLLALPPAQAARKTQAASRRHSWNDPSRCLATPPRGGPRHPIVFCFNVTRVAPPGLPTLLTCLKPQFKNLDLRETGEGGGGDVRSSLLTF